jgi:hypothetical protein
MCRGARLVTMCSSANGRGSFRRWRFGSCFEPRAECGSPVVVALAGVDQPVLHSPGRELRGSLAVVEQLTTVLLDPSDLIINCRSLASSLVSTKTSHMGILPLCLHISSSTA